MLRALTATATVVTALQLAAFYTRSMPTTSYTIPWFIPTIDSFLVLMAVCITLLAVGRFRVLRDSASFWIALGFSGFVIGVLFHLLTFPGLLPPGRSVITTSTSAPAISIFTTALTISVALLLSSLARLPGASTSTARIVLAFIAALVVTMLVHLTVVIVTPWFPPQVLANGSLAPFPIAMLWAVATISILGAVLSTRCYLHSQDPMHGFVALCQLATVYFSGVILVGDVARYGAWWYMQFIGWTMGFLTIFFGLLAGYVNLYRREQERTRLRQISEDRYRSLIQASAQAVWVATPGGEILEDSPSWRSFTGRSYEQIRGTGWLDAIHPDDRVRVTAVWQEAVVARREYQLEYRLRNAAGEYRDTAVRGVPVLDDDGRVREWIGMNTDVTEQRRAERSLHDSERKFRAVFEQSAIGMGRVSFTDARWIDVNEAFCEMLGYSHEEMRSIPWPQMTHPDDVDLDLIPFRRMAAGQLDSYSVEKRFIHKQGHHLWARMTLSLVRDAAGQPDYEVAIIEDITERKHTEQALRDSEERFRSVLESMSEGLMLFDASQNLIYQNPASLRIHGFDPTQSRIERERLPATWEAWDVNGKPLTFEEWPVSRVFRHEQFQDQVLHVRRVETGEEFHGSYNGSPIYDPDGKLMFGFITIRDITERFRDQAALAARERRLRAIFESGMVGLVYFTLDGAITDANDRLLQMLGYTRDELREVGWDRITPAAHREPDQRAIDELRRTGVETPYEKEFIRKDGSIVPVIVGAATFDEARREGVAFILDISERKRVEEELAAAHLSAERAKEIAEEATRAKDQFLAVLSHELRTPLAPVLAAITMLQDAPADTGVSADMLELIRRNVEMEARLIDDLLDVTRIVRGKIELHRRPILLHEVIDQAIDVCRRDIEERKLQLHADVDACGRHLVDADPARLQQAFWNLLKNAVKFTPVGGSLSICCRHVEGQVVTEITDTGEGIDPEVLPRLFTAFEQGGAQITRQFGGLGLGLTITRGIVELHGGSVRAHSPGRGLGATFEVRLPIYHGAVASRDGHPGQQGGDGRPGAATRLSRPLRILLVEDHADTARVMARLLAMRGHDVQTAGDVASALDRLTTGGFDLLLSDLGLPDGSGIDLVQSLRKSGHTLPAIALSGFGQEQDIQRSRDAGFAAHLVKPATPDLLLRTIDEVAAE